MISVEGLNTPDDLFDQVEQSFATKPNRIFAKKSMNQFTRTHLRKNLATLGIKKEAAVLNFFMPGLQHNIRQQVNNCYSQSYDLALNVALEVEGRSTKHPTQLNNMNSTRISNKTFTTRTLSFYNKKKSTLKCFQILIYNLFIIKKRKILIFSLILV